MSLLKKIKTAVAIIKIKPNSHTGVEFTPTVQEDVKTQEAVKRVRKYFEANWELLNARAMQAHSCVDPLSCTKKKCFKFAPDKIVSEPYIVSGPTPGVYKKTLNDGQDSEARHITQIKAEKKTKRKLKKCDKGCENKVYNQCYDCAQEEL